LCIPGIFAIGFLWIAMLVVRSKLDTRCCGIERGREREREEIHMSGLGRRGSLPSCYEREVTACSPYEKSPVDEVGMLHRYSWPV
jgi:hypothetical protein